MKIFDKFGKTFLQLDPQKRKLLVYGLIGLVILLMAFYLYHSRTSELKMKEEQEPKTKFEDIVPEVKILERSLYYETKKQTKLLEKKIAELEKMIEEQRQQLQAKEEERKKIEKELERIRKLIEKSKQQKTRDEAKENRTEDSSQFPPSPPSVSSIPPVVTEEATEKGYEPSWVGGIGEVQGEDMSKLDTVSPEGEQIKEIKEKKEYKQMVREVYLPPSFVSADLLNGFAAFTSAQGKQEPVRAFFRLRDLAVLPNQVKSDLKGCFVIGEAYGNLADERAHVRLLRLSCIARDGSSVIDAPVKGWVVDEDGRAGLKGRVVAKMGALLLRSLLAGFVEGFGEAYAESFYNVDVSGDQVIKTTSPEHATKIGLGKGLSKAGQSLSKFFMDLAHQTLPVIEIGAGKKVTIVFTEGVKLKIQKTCVKGRDGCIELKRSDGLSVLTTYYKN